jgi:murein DD-endopeptidase MepM/ murein hydrolase activator NlpD
LLCISSFADVPVAAICSGKLLLKKYASGYASVAVELCSLNKSPITIIYGHLQLAGIKIKSGQKISAGEIIGVPGKGYSSETDGERKHLHLGIHKGSQINLPGYVKNKSELAGWIDVKK